MSNFTFLNKRDKNGLLLRYKALTDLNQISDNALSIVKRYKIYNLLTKEFDQNFINNYYRKILGEELYSLSAQSTINYWHYENEGKFLKKEIPVDTTLPAIFIELAWNEKKFKFKINLFKKLFKIFKKKLIYFYYIYKNYKNNKKNVLSNKSTIAINYVEGHNQKKRNDLFWLKDSKLDRSSLLIYFESKKKMIRFTNYSKLKKDLNKLSVKHIKLWDETLSDYSEDFEEINSSLKYLKPKDDIENWLLGDAIILISKIQYWYSFFKDFNVKIHINAEERGTSNIIKQLALDKLKSLSIGKLRSFPRNLKDDWLGFYPNNAFFVWGKETSIRMKKSGNCFDNLIISGYPYPDNSEQQDLQFLSKLKMRFNEQGVKFIIMLLDGTHADNNNYKIQGILTNDLIKYYKNFFEWLKNEKDLGIILKSKRYDYLIENKKMKKIINDANNTKRLFISDSYNFEPKNYSSIIDFSVSIACDIPTSALQMAVYGAKSIIYDYPNLKKTEDKLYQWGNKKVIFKDLEELIIELKKFKNGQSNNINLGDWSKNIDDIDAFMDKKGYMRISDYLIYLQQAFNLNYEGKKALKFANNQYSKKWGEDKIT